MDLPLRDDDACAGHSGRPGRHRIVDRVQQGSVQIEKDCRGGRIFPGEIFVGGHFFRGITRSASDQLWMRVPAGVQQKNLSKVDFLCPLELCFAVGFRS
jgi:hypothetical protein